MNYQELLQKGKMTLAAFGKEEADAKHLLFYLKKWSITEYLRYGQEEVSEQERQAYFRLLEKRTASIPLQEITGSQNFYGYEIAVSKEVLTPRPETEQLVEVALKAMQDLDKPKVLDLCTGSGCIAIAVAGENKEAQVIALDLSDQALALAEKNGAENRVGERIVWCKSDLFEALTEKEFDIILSNPPYIPTKEIEELEEEVKHYDPLSALDGGEDGLYFYRKIAENGAEYLKLGGRLFLEIGDGQGDEVADILQQQGWENIRVLPDYSGRQRMVLAQKSGANKSDLVKISV